MDIVNIYIDNMEALQDLFSYLEFKEVVYNGFRTSLNIKMRVNDSVFNVVFKTIYYYRVCFKYLRKHEGVKI